MSQQKSPHEDFIMAFLVVFIVGGLCFAIWYFFHAELTNFARWVRVGELWMVRFLFGDDYSAPTLVNNVPTTDTVRQWRLFLPKIPTGDITMDAMKRATVLTVLPLRIVFLALMGIMMVVIIFRGPGTQYKRRMGLETLLQEQAKSFPAIRPFLKFDPRKLPFRVTGGAVPSQLPMFAEALSPEEWIAYHEISYVNGQLDMNRAYHALAEQLGRRWQGPQKLPIYSQGLFAVCALKMARKRKESVELLNDLADSWSADKGFRPTAAVRSKINAAIKNPKFGGALLKFADQHAYETTALLRCMQRAREEGGVLAPAEFIWLRGVDRNLWYPMNNLGRKSYCAEASGAMVHYMNELIAAQKIPTPRFEETIRGLEAYMKSPSARAIPELDKTKGKRKSKSN